jgi:hypothetical protein
MTEYHVFLSFYMLPCEGHHLLVNFEGILLLRSWIQPNKDNHPGGKENEKKIINSFFLRIEESLYNQQLLHHNSSDFTSFVFNKELFDSIENC